MMIVELTVKGFESREAAARKVVETLQIPFDNACDLVIVAEELKSHNKNL